MEFLTLSAADLNVTATEVEVEPLIALDDGRLTENNSQQNFEPTNGTLSLSDTEEITPLADIQSYSTEASFLIETASPRINAKQNDSDVNKKPRRALMPPTESSFIVENIQAPPAQNKEFISTKNTTSRLTGLRHIRSHTGKIISNYTDATNESPVVQSHENSTVVSLHQQLDSNTSTPTTTTRPKLSGLVFPTRFTKAPHSAGVTYSSVTIETPGPQSDSTETEQDNEQKDEKKGSELLNSKVYRDSFEVVGA